MMGIEPTSNEQPGFDESPVLSVRDAGRLSRSESERHGWRESYRSPAPLFVLLGLFALAACQSGPGGAARGDVTGIYALAAVDGLTLPAEVSHDGVMLRVRSGTFMISEDGTCFSRTRFVSPEGNENTREARCKYKWKEARLIMRWQGAGITEGTVESGVFTMDNHGMIFRYEKTG